MFAKRKLWFSAAAGIVLLALVLLGWYFFGRSPATPRLSVVTPPKVSLSGQQEVVVDVTIDRLGDALYPAASLSRCAAVSVAGGTPRGGRAWVSGGHTGRT